MNESNGSAIAQALEHGFVSVSRPLVEGHVPISSTLRALDDGKHGVELFVGHVSVTASHEVKVTDETLEFGLVQDVIAIAIVTLPNASKHLFGHHFGDSDLFEQPRTSFGIP